MKSLSALIFIWWLFLSATSFAWNTVGHQVIAQIAYHHLTPHAKATYQRHLHAMDKIYPSKGFMDAAIWLDEIRQHDFNWFNSIHYIDQYFTEDKSPLPQTESHHHAVWAIDEASRVLKSARANAYEKGLSFRILLHVVGDLHQPMHAASRVSKNHPEGDLGGNLLKLGKNPIANNLHAYWDKGAGLLVIPVKNREDAIQTLVSRIEKNWLCHFSKIKETPRLWAEESYQLAIAQAYQIEEKKIPEKTYQNRAQTMTQQRLSQAGCRLAKLLNDLDQPS